MQHISSQKNKKFSPSYSYLENSKSPQKVTASSTPKFDQEKLKKKVIRPTTALEKTFK